MGDRAFYSPDQTFAFPGVPDPFRDPVPGLTQRAYIATHALAGLLASYAGDPGQALPSNEHAARVSVAYADALLTELAKPREGHPALADELRLLPVPAADDEATVVRVARAIMRSDFDDEELENYAWANCDQAAYKHNARAAIAAMREGAL
jgi:hypothetical protein